MTQQVAIIGAGLMGSGIAQVAAVAGLPVVLQDVTEVALRRGLDGIEKSLNRFVTKGKLTEADAQAALQRITPSTDLGSAAEADIVIEAVFESLDVKHGLFTRLDELCKEGAVLASNTSAIPISQLAAATRRPESVVGTHFFSPQRVSSFRW